MMINEIHMFKELSSLEQSRLFGSMDKMEFLAGAVIFEQGDQGDCMYVIDDGKIELYTADEEGHKHTLTVLDRGEAFGEMSLLTGTSRTASAMAVYPATLYRLSIDTFNQLIEENNVISNYFLRLLSKRLAQADITLQRAESVKQRLIRNDFDRIPEEMQAVVLFTSLLPVCKVGFMAGLFKVDGLSDQIGNLARSYPNILSWNEQSGQITLHPSAIKQFKEIYHTRFDDREKNRLVEAAAQHYIAEDRPQYAVQVYVESNLWHEACQTADLFIEKMVDDHDLCLTVMALLEHCPDQIFSAHHVLLFLFLETYLHYNPKSGFNKLECIISGKYSHFTKEQEISLYQVAAEYCNKLNYGQKSLEYLHLAMNLANTLGKKAPDGLSRVEPDVSRMYQLSKRQLRSTLGVSLAIRMNRSLFKKNRMIKAIPFAIAAAIIFLFHNITPFAGLSGDAMTFIGISVAAVILWIVDIIPGYIVSLLMLFLWVILKLVKPEVALSGFASPAWLYMLCTLALGAAISKSGLLYRLSLYVLKAFPKTQIGQLFGLAISGLVMTPLIPSSTAKVSLSSPIAQGISEAMGFPQRSNGSAGLGLGAMVFYGFLTPFFLTGSSFNVMVLGLMPGKTDISWIQWFLYALPTLLIFSVSMFLIIAVVFKPEKVKKKLSTEVLNEQLRILGDVTKDEVITIAVTVAVVTMLVLQAVHQIDSTWILLAGFCCLVISGVLDRATFKNGVDWPFLLFTGVFFSFANVLAEMGIVNVIMNVLSMIMQPFMSTPYLFLPAAIVITFFLASTIREDATAILLTVAMCPIAQGIGIHPWILVMVILLASDPFFYASQSTTYLTAYYSTEEKSFSHKQGQKLSVYYACMVMLSIVLSIPFWQMLGLIK